MKINPLVSIIIPLKTYNESLKKILYSIYNRRFRDFEVIIVSSEESNTLNKLRRKYQFRLFYNKDGKSASRNFGAGKAKGKYLFHLDNDMLLSIGLLTECISLCKTKKLKAVAITETAEDKDDSLYGRVRILEKIIVARDKNIVAPRFIEKNLFEELGGFNEKLDPIDDGDLLAKIQEKDISYAVTKNKIVIIGLRNRYSFTSRLRYMFERGQKASLFRANHPQSKQLRPFHRLNPYFKNINLLIRNPITSFVLIVLKMFDLIALEAGSILMTENDKKLLLEIKNKKIFEEEAGSYQEEFYENTIGGRFVDDQEKKIVKKYLEGLDKEKTFQILDIGAGGGRWSKMMLDLFPRAKITAYDLSGGMVRSLNNKYKEYGKKFHAVIGDMQYLPFRDNSYDLVISIRSVKYAKDQNKVFSEIYRVLTPSGKAIIELPNFNFIYRFIRRFNFFGKLSGYANRIIGYDINTVNKNLDLSGLRLLKSDIRFPIPSTLYKHINNQLILDVINIIEKVLPVNIFGRSVFYELAVNKDINFKYRNPLVSIIIPTKNSGKLLKICLTVLKNQSYKNIEILIVDGCSKDNTLDIAKQYNIKIIRNLKVLAEPGIDLGMRKAKGEFLMVLATDNIFKDERAIETIINVFKDSTIDVAFPKHESEESDTIFSKYINTFTDPFTHFVYHNGANARTFKNIYRTLEHNQVYDVYDFKSNTSIPMLAFAQGFTIRKRFTRSKKDKFDDIRPVLSLIRQGEKIAYVYSVAIYHHTVNDWQHFFRKTRWASRNAFLGKNYGLSYRMKYLSREQKLRVFIWPFYAGSFIFPLLRAIYGLIKDKELIWLFHPFICLLSITASIIELFLFKLGLSHDLSRQ